MPARPDLDVPVPRSIADPLRRRGVDCLTSTEDGADTLADHERLDRATTPGRVLFTQDIRFKALAGSWQRQGRPFTGPIFGHQLGGTIGQSVRDLDLIAGATDPDDRRGVVQPLPF